MKKSFFFLILFILSLNVVTAATFKLNSREYVENERGEIIEVDASVTNSRGEVVSESAPVVARIKNSQDLFISTQHILIPSNAEIRLLLLNTKGSLVVDGSVLDEKIVQSENISFRQIKLLVREIE